MSRKNAGFFTQQCDFMCSQGPAESARICNTGSTPFHLCITGKVRVLSSPETTPQKLVMGAATGMMTTLNTHCEHSDHGYSVVQSLASVVQILSRLALLSRAAAYNIDHAGKQR